MMNVQLLVCLRCGGPLGKVEAVPAIVECEFCAAVISIGHGAPAITRESTADAKRDADHRASREAFIAALNAMAEAGRDPFESLCEAAARFLGAAGETQALARITFAIATDFEADTGAKVCRDGIVLNRIAEGYLRVLSDLRSAPSVELNLPFLTADATGPKHLLRTLSPAILGELAQREPGARAHRAAQPPTTETEAAARPARKKRSWWPFGS